MATVMWISLKNAVREYCEVSTIHGLPLIVAKKRHIFERLLWLILIILAVGGALALCLSNWVRYEANPTVVSLEKDFRNWHNPFPATTGCFVDKVDEKLAEEYIKQQWKLDKTHEKYDYYLEFVKTIANVSYASMPNISQYQGDKTLNDIDLLELSVKVHPVLTGDLVTFDSKRKDFWDLIITEFGICFTTNTKSRKLFLVESWKKDNTTVSDKLLECHFLNGLCYARYDSEPHIAVLYFVHSPYDVIHTTSEPPLYLPAKSELEINYKMQETRPAASLRRLSIRQRRCRFYNEPMDRNFPVYSSSLCQISCRYREAMSRCGCRPHFYHNLRGKACNVDGIACLSKYVDFFTRPLTKMECNCDQPCEVITYFPQVPHLTEWIEGFFDQRVAFRWALEHPTLRFHRDILFGFEDLVASFGGTASLFFGMSFLSVTELVFFIVKKLLTLLFMLGSKLCNFNRTNADITNIQIKSVYPQQLRKKGNKTRPFEELPYYN